MPDREWFTVEHPNGALATDSEFPNRETAVSYARERVKVESRPLEVAKYTRKAVRTFTPKVSIEETDLTTGAVTTT